MSGTFIYESKKCARKTFCIETAIITVISYAILTVSGKLFDDIDFKLRACLILIFWMICFLFAFFNFLLDRSYILKIHLDEINKRVEIHECRLWFLRREFEFEEFAKFSFVAFCNEVSQDSIIRASTGQEFGAALCDDDKIKITDCLNKFMESVE